MSTLSGPTRKPTSGTAKQLIILLHGWGADGPNLFDIADFLAPSLPDAYFAAPNAPEACEANPYGYQWFPLMDRRPENMIKGVRGAADIVNKYADELLKETGVAADKLALIGFSQGTMTALQVAMRRVPQMGCVVGFSGAVIGAELLGSEIKAKPPVCLIHGEMDDIVPYASLAHAEATLKAQGVSVETHTRPNMGHSIDMEGLETAKRFLQQKLS